MNGVNDYKTANSAKLKSTQFVRKVIIIAFDGVNPIDVSGPSSAFARANALIPGSYDVVHASMAGGSINADGGLVLGDLACLADITDCPDTVIIAGGSPEGLWGASSDGQLLAWLQKHSSSVRRIGSVCTGAFILAATGLLDQKRAVTHWASCDLLQSMFPNIQVDANAIYIMDGHTFTSAGVTASIALALIENDCGREIAAKIARSLVLFLRRPGGQSQFSQAMSAQMNLSPSFDDLPTWIVENMTADLSVSALAKKTSMSERSFTRHFSRETGKTPAAYVKAVRLERACHWLETTKWPIKKVATEAGYGSTDSLERTLKAEFGISPQALRNAYGLKESPNKRSISQANTR